MRQKPVTIEVRKNGQHWAVLAEEQLIALTVYEKGAQTLEAVLRGCLRYTSRKLFRQAISDAMKGPKPVEPVKSHKAKKAKVNQPKTEAAATGKKKSVKKGKVTDTNPASTPLPVPAQSLSAPVDPTSAQQDPATSH